MKRKIRLLIGACIFTVVALATIQGYFIYNTYQLIEKEVHAGIKKQVTDLEDTEEWFSIYNVWMDNVQDFVDDHVDGKAKGNDLQKYLGRNSDSLTTVIKKYMHKMKKPGDYDIDYSIHISSITLTNDKVTDSIFKGNALALANGKEEKTKIKSADGRWEHEQEHNGIKSSIVVKSQRYYGFGDWKHTIIKKMGGLLAFSVLLMAFVVYLYYLSLKNLISQKRIADIKTDFVNNITHEFQTPLATMDIAVKTLKRKEQQMSVEHYQHTISMIERQNERLQKLFRQVTEASVTPIASDDSISITCHEIKEMISDFKLSKPDVNITCQQEQPALTVKMDPFHLNTIIVNLLDNAVKYGGDIIGVDLKIENGNFLLSVKDNGKGIPVQEQASIFDKFYRAEKGNIHDTKGLGLGLFYIKQLVETYKGKIKVESEEGKGAMFLITIPV